MKTQPQSNHKEHTVESTRDFTDTGAISMARQVTCIDVYSQGTGKHMVTIASDWSMLEGLSGPGYWLVLLHTTAHHVTTRRTIAHNTIQFSWYTTSLHHTEAC